VQLETTTTTVNDEVATLVLNRPHVLNCANEQWAIDLNAAVDDPGLAREYLTSESTYITM